MDFKGFDDWVEIAEGGIWSDSNGAKQDCDVLIDKAIETFDPSYHEPPIVLGHPKNNAPSYGWVEGLKKVVKDGKDVLMAKFKQVVPEFEDSVKRGLIKKRSSSFYSDGRLRHVGFLGAAPPAIKGLADMAFNDDADAITIDFNETSSWTWEAVARIFRRLREYIIEKDSKETADTIIPDWDVDAIRDEATNTEEKESDVMKFSEFLEAFKFWKKLETDPGGDISIPAAGKDQKTFTEADIEAAKKTGAEAERKKTETEFAEKERTAKREAHTKEISDFCDTLVKEGKIPPSWVDSGLVEFVNSLDSETEISFSEKGEKKSPADWFKSFLEGFEKSKIFQELATKEKAGQSSDFAEAKKEQEVGESIAAKVN